MHKCVNIKKENLCGRETSVSGAFGRFVMTALILMILMPALLLAGCAGIFSAMLGEVITVDELKDGSYVEKLKPISAADWITPDSPPTVVAYGTHDRIQPFKASLRLKAALEENGVDHVYLELPHSGHGLQNDNAIQKQWMEAIVDYLDKYMPVK